MRRLLLLADDYTGALDAGVRLSEQGVSVRVVSEREGESAIRDCAEEALSIDMGSRRLAPESAKTLVSKLVRIGIEHGFDHFYKKTDSALRGNIGAELAGMIDAAGSDAAGVTFVPAFPESGRTVSGGILYIDGVPVSDSVFGKDPFTPVMKSSVAEIIRGQTDFRTETVRRSQYGSLKEPFEAGCVRIVDAETTGDIDAIGEALKGTENTRFLSGCAGFAKQLPALIGFDRTEQPGLCPADGLLVISGSLNPTTLKQVEWGKENGFTVFTLTREQKTRADYLDTIECAAFVDMVCAALTESGRVIIRSAGAAPEDEETLLDGKARTEKNIAAIASRVLNRSAECGLAVFGGDTLSSILLELGVAGVIPVREIEPGTVAATIEIGSAKRLLITKSGGLGSPDILGKILSFLYSAYLPAR